MAGLREQNKTLRRDAILDATLDLLREHHPSEITTSQIASAAGVSSATIFNLVGTRDQLFTALVGRVIDAIFDALYALEQHSSDPIARCRLIIDVSVAAFTADSKAYRRVISARSLRHDAGNNHDFDPARLQEASLREAQEQGIIDAGFNAAGLGTQVFASYSAAMMRWATRRIDDAGFLVLARHGLVTVLAATATDAHREQFRDELVALSTSLSQLPTRA